MASADGTKVTVPATEQVLHQVCLDHVGWGKQFIDILQVSLPWTVSVLKPEACLPVYSIVIITFYTTTTITTSTTTGYYYNCYYHYYSNTTSVLLLLLPLPLLLVQSDLFNDYVLISQQCSQTLPVIPTNMNNSLHTHLVVQFTVDKLFCKGSQDFHLKCSLNHIKFLLSI